MMSVESFELRKARELAQQDRFDEALRLCDQFIDQNPSAWTGYREKADILQIQKKLDEALALRTTILDLGSDEPSDFYDVARLCFAMGHQKDCRQWAERGIEICKQHGDEYYIESLVFYKAYSSLLLGDFEDAKATCSSLDKDFAIHLSEQGEISCSDIIRKAEESLASRKGSRTSWRFEDD